MGPGCAERASPDPEWMLFGPRNKFRDLRSAMARVAAALAGDPDEPRPVRDRPLVPGHDRAED
jgi:hypothetical protein